MAKQYYRSVFQTLLILGLGFMLLLSQTNRLHTHLVHADHASGHVVNVHISSTLHDYELTHHHNQASHHEDHHSQTVDFNSESLVKKVSVLNPWVMILLVFGIFLNVPHLACRIQQRFYKKQFKPYYYFFQPPLRAPPVTYYG